MEKPPYQAAYGQDDKHYVDGPANAGECSYHGGLMYPEYRFEDKATAEKAAKLANIGYEQGYAQAQRDIRRTLGL